LALGALATPWAALGALPIIAAANAERERFVPVLVRNVLWIPAFAVAAVIGLYFQSSEASMVRGFIWQRPLLENADAQWPRIALGLVCDAVVPLAIAALAIGESPRARRLYVAAATTLLVIPIYRVGIYHDFAMRVSIPALYVVWLFVARGLVSRRATRLRRGIAIAVLVVGAATPAQEIARSLLRYESPRTPPAPLHVPDLDRPIARQYMGTLDSTFSRWFAAEPRPDRGATGAGAASPE
jgi:hypothetical protein